MNKNVVKCTCCMCGHQWTPDKSAKHRCNDTLKVTKPKKELPCTII